MFKVSFKDYPKCPAKRVKRKGDVTTVTLIGRMKIPSEYIIPDDVYDWMTFHKGIEVNMDIANSMFILKVQGIATKHPDDKDNPVYAERIAETRAKIKIYKFVYYLSEQLRFYFSRWLYDLGKSTAKYSGLSIKESHHLGKLLEES